MLWQCFNTLLGSMGYATKAAGGSYQLQPPITTNISHRVPRPTAPLFSFLWRVLSNIGKWAICETGRANHCCGSVSIHCLGPWNTPQRQQKAATTTNHNKHQPYLGKLPPFFHSLRVLPSIGKWATVRQGEPTIVVAVFQYIARAHGSHHKHTRRQLEPPITTNISHTLASCPPFSFLKSLDQILANGLL